MIVGDLNFACVAFAPYEADPVLIIDLDAVLPFAVTLECFQAIAWENRKIGELPGRMDLHELSLDDVRKPAISF
jgi:hypothetical protein